MKKILLKVLVGMVIMGGTAFALPKLIVGTNSEYAPYEYLENQKLVGFDVELMEEIGKEIGYEIQWADMSFDGLIPALQMKKIDAVIAGLSPTEDRKKAVEFSVPYIKKEGTHYVMVNEKSTIKTKKELKGKEVGVQLATIQEGFAKDLGGIPAPYSSFLGALMALQQEKVDAVIIAQSGGDNFLKTMKKIKVADIIIDKNPGESIAFSKGEKELAEKVSRAIEKIQKTQKYEELYKKYFPQNIK